MQAPSDPASASASVTAEAHIAAARKLLKVSRLSSFFSLSSSTPDYEAAAQKYEEAARCLRNAKINHALAIECLVHASENWANAGSHFQAAKAAATAAATAAAAAAAAAAGTKDAAALRAAAADLYERAARHHVLAQNEESAAESLSKAAEVVQDCDAECAAKLHAQSIDYYFEEEKYRTAIQPIKDAIAFAVTRQRSNDVMNFMDRLVRAYSMPASRPNAHGMSQASMSLFMYHVHEGDRVMALRETEKGLLEPEAARVAAEILEATDEASFRRALGSQCLTFLDPCIVRLIREIDFTAVAPAPASASASALASANADANATATAAAATAATHIPGFTPYAATTSAAAATSDNIDENDLC